MLIHLLSILDAVESMLKLVKLDMLAVRLRDSLGCDLFTADAPLVSWQVGHVVSSS